VPRKGPARTFMKLAALLLLSSCRDGGDNTAQQLSVRLSPHEPGSTAFPSNPNSVELYSMDGAKRLVLFQDMVLKLAQPCASVTGAVLKGGAGGMSLRPKSFLAKDPRSG